MTCARSTLLAALAALAALVSLAPAPALAQFTYRPPGELVSGSGRGRVDSTVYAPGIRFPIEAAPAYANSQVWGVGGSQGPAGSQCDARNYSYPWRDNYCESRSWTMPMCPAGTGHQGQDIRPSTCANNVHWAVATVDGTITNIGSYSVYLTAADGTRYDYLHMSSVAVRVGQSVRRGDRMGRVSNNFGGTPTTIHLHFNIRRNVSGFGSVYAPTYMSLVRSYEALTGTPPPPPPVPRFRAEYVAQSFPLASTTLDLMPGQTRAGFIELRNTGSETWVPGRTFLGTTQPRDRSSPCAAPGWVGPNRPATIDRMVPAGMTGRFNFTLRAPMAAGEYREYFGVVQEGVAWFSDPGQGGPPDNQLQVRVRTVPMVVPQYRAEFVSQTFPRAPATLDLPLGGTAMGYIELRNTGSETWVPGDTFLGTTQPRDRVSAVAGVDWESPTRAATVDRMVPPGMTGRFAFTIRATNIPGTYDEHFNLVEEGVAWFSDPGQGGPTDNFLRVIVRAQPSDAGTMMGMPDAMVALPDAGMTQDDAGDAGDGGDAASDARDAGDGARDGGAGMVAGGCGCAVPGSDGGTGRSGGAALALVALAIALSGAARSRGSRARGR